MLFRLLPAIGFLLIGPYGTASPVSAPAEILPLASSLNITLLTTQGSGCPSSMTSVSTSPNRTIITLGFDEFYVSIGPGVPVSGKNKNCIVVLSIEYQTGYTLDVLDTTYYGSARLDESSGGNIFSSYSFTSSAAGDSSTSTRAEVTGPLFEKYKEDVAIPENSRINAPCGLNKIQLQISTRISVVESRVSMGSVFGDPPFSLDIQQIHLGWLPCNI